jgi:hypothetical protein
VAEIEATEIKDWFPNELVYPYRELLSMGVTKHGVTRISDFWTRRNLRALARLWAEASVCGDIRLVRAAKFVLTSMFGRIARTTCYNFRRAGNKSLSSLLYISSITAEDNIRRQLETKLRQCLTTFTDLRRMETRSGTQQTVVATGSATSLKFIPDNSVDYVFTDPPFGGNIFYSDASMLYEAWLGEVTNESDELVFHRRSKQQRIQDNRVFKELDDYAAGMKAAFAEMFRVLKPDRWATIEFNNSDGKVFDIIKEGIKSVGFEIVNMLLLDKEQKSFKQHQGADGSQDVVDKDVFFNIHKPAVVCSETCREDHDLEQQVAHSVRHHLQTLPERIKADPAKYNDEHRTTATINSMLMNALIPKGVDVDRLNLPFIERVCGRYFRKVGQRWYLRGEAVGNEGVSSSLIEEEVFIRDELSAIEWIRQYLKREAALIGELKPMWMRATGLLPSEVSQTLVLEDLLAENFWRDTVTNRWREPTDRERERMNDDRSLRVLHDADRFAAGTLRRATTDAERCEWIEVLFKACEAVEDDEGTVLPTLRGFEPAEGYRLISQLFHTVLREKVAPTAYTRAEKQARVASQRLSKALEAKAQKAKAKRREDEEPTRFDVLDNT